MCQFAPCVSLGIKLSFVRIGCSGIENERRQNRSTKTGAENKSDGRADVVEVLIKVQNILFPNRGHVHNDFSIGGARTKNLVVH